MKYETAKNLNNTRFKRLIGVAKPVFDEMVKVLKAEYQVKHARGGRKPKLAMKRQTKPLFILFKDIL